jgi:hypothetical protein
LQVRPKEKRITVLHALENLTGDSISFIILFQSMKSFLVIIFSRFYLLLKDDFSAMAVLAYFFSLNIFTVIGCYQHFFLHSSLSELPLFYSLIIMLLAAVFAQTVILKSIKPQLYLKKANQPALVKEKKEAWITLLYVVSSFVLMLSVV